MQSCCCRGLDRRLAEPVRLHINAKRYLVRVDPAYARGLSSASQDTLRLQGGSMVEAERRDLQSRSFWRHALQLGCWDDEAKVVGLTVPTVSAYRELLQRLSR